jgi:hypothetical protein
VQSLSRTSSAVLYSLKGGGQLAWRLCEGVTPTDSKNKKKKSAYYEMLYRASKLAGSCKHVFHKTLGIS